MPLRWRGRLRKRWRWAGAFAEELIVFCAAVEVGPARLGFWGVWDRERRELAERTRRGLPWRRPEVAIAPSDPNGGATARIAAPGCSAELEFAGGEAVESICPTGEAGYSWTRKLAGVPVGGQVALGGRRLAVRGRGVIDETAGYHARRTSWLWSAGVGRARDGRELAWNLVEGVNDPPRGSERAIWVEGHPGEPDPVRFDGLESVRFADGSTLQLVGPEAERARTERLPPLVRSDYRARLGSFGGSLAGIELDRGLGVMEGHDARW